MQKLQDTQGKLGKETRKTNAVGDINSSFSVHTRSPKNLRYTGLKIA